MKEAEEKKRAEAEKEEKEAALARGETIQPENDVDITANFDANDDEDVVF